jgi:hypothetical protein
MPYNLAKVPEGYYVETEETGRRHSKMPLSRKMATRQMGALYANVAEARGGNRPGIWRGTMHRLEQTGNPLRPKQHFSSLYDVNAVVTQFPNNK